MDPTELLRDPLLVIGLAIAIFVVRVMYLARRLKSAARNPSLADLRALNEAKKSLDSHKVSIDAARGTLTKNIEGARDTLRYYRGPLDRARKDRTKALSGALHQEAFEEAKKLYKSAVPTPRSKTRSKREASKDLDRA